MDPVLNFDDRVTCLPVVHGSGDCAYEVRRMLLEYPFDCLAVPLPPSFKKLVEQAVDRLPQPAAVVQKVRRDFTGGSGDQPDAEASYVPIDPCQPVIAAIRVAFSEHKPVSFIDLETNRFEVVASAMPDPYALKKVPLAKFNAALLPAVGPLPEGQPTDRIRCMAMRLHQLARRYEKVVFLCSVLEWPWVRQAYQQLAADQTEWELPEDEEVESPVAYDVKPETLMFLLGELPFITSLYERANAELENDDNVSIDGVKELLLAARDAYNEEFKQRARKITPHLLRCMLRYSRNLSLIESRMTPDLYTLVIAAQQTAGDSYALHVAELAAKYQFGEKRIHTLPVAGTLQMGIDQGRFKGGPLHDEVVTMVSRLPGPPMVWRSCELKRRPHTDEQRKWEMKWNPYSQCSWPPEDLSIERFREHVFQKARAAMGQDLARTEKFTTSVQDGIDVRDTLRHWHEGDIYVKVIPPTRGRLDAAVMLFDSPADPRDYPYRMTWHSEFEWESTLVFFATQWQTQVVGPGIARSNYGGCMMLYPPTPINEVWRDREFDFVDTLEERLIAAACRYARSKQVAILSAYPPGGAWRKLAKRFGKQLVHLPLSSFSDATIQQLRTFHVLNGKQVRSYAQEFIRKS